MAKESLARKAQEVELRSLFRELFRYNRGKAETAAARLISWKGEFHRDQDGEVVIEYPHKLRNLETAIIIDPETDLLLVSVARREREGDKDFPPAAGAVFLKLSHFRSVRASAKGEKEWVQFTNVVEGEAIRVYQSGAFGFYGGLNKNRMRG